MKGIIGIPWYKSSQLMTATDAVDNEFYFYSIPMWTLIFSVIDILKCTVLTNIFNVYIGKISSWAIFKKYVNLIFGQLPFFLHAILFRVLAYSFLVLYLNNIAIVPIFCIWLSNLVIGYAMASNKQARNDLRGIQSHVHNTANVPRLEGSRRAILQNSTPIWLNSFFSIMVPTCSVNIIDPQLVHSNEGNEELQSQFSNFNKRYQMKAMRMLLLASNFIILVSVGLVCWRVNRPESSSWHYNANIFGNLEFNILCCVLFVMGMMSMVFIKSTDVYELLRLNNHERREEQQVKTNKCIVLMKIFVTAACIVILLG